MIGVYYSNVNIRVFSLLFSRFLFILLYSIKILVGGGVVGSTPSLAINIDSYVYACIRVLRVSTLGVYFYLGENKGAGTFWSLVTTIVYDDIS